MGTILKFIPSEPGETGPKADGTQKKTGEIIIFPGVRYERTPRPKSKIVDGKRDYLEL